MQQQQRVEDAMETIHLYVVREEKEPLLRRPSLLPVCLWVGVLLTLLAVGALMPFRPPEVHTTLRVPAVFLPLKTFRTSVIITSTGVKTSPATNATGTLTLTNGSIVSQALPKGMIFIGSDGVEVTTETAVWVPAGSAAGYGSATVSAHVVPFGLNIATLDINQVIGTSLYVRNLAPFTGGRKALTVTVRTPQDRQRAIVQARQALLPQTLAAGLLFAPCTERMTGDLTLTVSWQCRFVTYHIPSFMQVTGVRLQGKYLFVQVVFVARPKPFPGK